MQELIGKKFGKLTVIELDHKEPYYLNGKIQHWKYYYRCICDCGKETIVNGSDIQSRHTQSCGCLQRVKTSKTNKTHGLSHTRIHNIWQGIKQRCLNPNRKIYKNYGGRGIQICNEWKTNFMSFYNWAMANGYNDTLSIDRINNDGDYEPSNCRWITQKEQNRNTSQNLLITYKGETHCRNEWAEILNVKSGTILSRYKRGLNLETGRKD